MKPEYPEENHLSQVIDKSHNVASSTAHRELGVRTRNLSGDRH